MYYKKFRTAFTKHNSPIAMLHSFAKEGKSSKQMHFDWINSLRDQIWERVVFEDNLIPSVDALYRHFLKAMLVIHYWKQSTNNTITLPPIDKYGWKKNNGTVSPDWDSDENIKAVEDRVSFLLKGCRCEKTQCGNNRCRCFKSNKQCGPGCSCINCTNITESKGEIFLS